MDENDFRRLLDANATETRRHFDVAVERLDAKVGSLDANVASLDAKVGSLDANVASLDAKVGSLDAKVDSVAAEMRRHFDVAAERLASKIELIAETVGRLDDKYERRIDDLEERMERGFTETQAMIKFSHAELDRRVRALEDSHRTLEENLSDLQARVEHLESSTH